MVILRLLLIGLWLTTLSGCTHLLFYPTKQHRLTPDQVQLVYQDHYFQSADGTQLHSWWLPTQIEAKATVIYVHGNAQNISNHLGNVYWLPAEGVNLFIFDYRGYGHSSGEVSLPGAIADIDAALQQAIQLADGTPVVLIGHSLGAAMSIHSLAHSPLKPELAGTILAAPFSDYHQITREVLAKVWLFWPFQYPLSWTINNNYSPLESVAQLAPLPQLYLHSPQDDIIALHHSEALYEEAEEPKQLLKVAGGHNEIFTNKQNRQQILDQILRWSRAIPSDN